MDVQSNGRNNTFQSATDIIDANIEFISQYFEGNEAKSAVSDLKETFLAFQALQTEWNKTNECLKRVKDIVAKDQNNISLNVEEEYEKLLAKSGKIRYDKERSSDEFDSKMNKCLVLKQDTDVMETQSVLTLIDPITKQTMKKPVKNIHCKHTYDLVTITEMIKSKKGKGMKCPYQGCGNTLPLKVDDLITDEVTSRKLKQMS